MQSLLRNCASLGTMEGAKQNNYGEAESGTRLNTKGPSGRLPYEKITHRPDNNTSHYNQTVNRMELSCLH